jgi:HPt (histidine-containing phosphotransfer) domain-containing protein
MPDQKSYDLSFLNRISGGDEDFIREMISTFRQIAPEYISKVRQLHSSGSIDVLSKETHRFIPGVSFLGAKRLEEDLLKIEEFTKKKVSLEEIPELIESVNSKISILISEFDRDFK